MPTEIGINTLQGGGLNSVHIKDINFYYINTNIDSDMCVCVASRPLTIKQIFNEDQCGRPLT